MANNITDEQAEKIRALAARFNPDNYVDTDYNASENGNFDDTFQDGIKEGKNEVYHLLSIILKDNT